MQAYYQEIIPPSGVEYATSLNFTPSSKNSASSSNDTARVITNLVTARSNWLRIFEVREQAAVLPSLVDEERRHGSGTRSRRGTEAVEGEVEMDAQGEGFVNVGTVKSASIRAPSLPTVTRLRLIREHRLHGTVTGMGRIQTLSTNEDGLDRLIVSFKDAKIAVLEWSEAFHDVATVSIHTYERTPQVMSPSAHLYTSMLRIDPLYRCASLLLPHDAIAVLPFYQAQAELDMVDQDISQDRATKEVPYSPSFVLELASIDDRIRNVVDFTFLPGFNNPTIAILFQPQQTWTGRLKEHKDTTDLFVITLDPLSQTYPIISSSTSLPYDCLSITPCPPILGSGVVITCSNSIIYVESGGSPRRVVLPVNGWASRVAENVPPFQTTESKINESGGQPATLTLEGSVLAFPSKAYPTALVISAEGLVYQLHFIVEGHSVSRLMLDPSNPIGRGIVPATILPIDAMDDLVFVGSCAGMSTLLKTTGMIRSRPERSDVVKEQPSPITETLPEVDFEDDIYGDRVPSASSVANGHTQSNGTLASITFDKPIDIHLVLSDSLPGHGPVADMSFSLGSNGEKPVTELVAATGSGTTGGFLFYQHVLPTRTKRKLHAIGGSKGIWTIPLRQPPKHTGAGGVHLGCSSVIVSTDGNPSPGLSRVAARSVKSDVLITSRATATTMGAGSFFQGTAILQVTANSVRLLEPDGTERQAIKDVEGTVARPKIRACSISDPFVFFIREDNTIGLFIGESERGKVRRKDMSAMGEKTSRYAAGSFFTDKSGLFQTHVNPGYQSPSGSSKVKSAATSSLEAATDVNRGTQWLLLCRPQGIVEIWSLPTLRLAFSIPALPTLPSVIVDSLEPPALSLPESIPRKPHESDIEQLVITSLGHDDDRPCLTILLRGGHVAVYEIVATPIPSELPPTRELVLPLQFFKIKTHVIPPDELLLYNKPEFNNNPLLRKGSAARLLHTFNTTINSGDRSTNTSFSGVFLAGDHPLWILGTDKGGIQIYNCQQNIVYAFTACPMWSSESDASTGGEFLMYTDEGPLLLGWRPEYTLDTPLPARRLPQGKPYSHVRYDVTTGLLVAAAALSSRFTLFDEEGTRMWEPETPDASDPRQHCSALELISPEDGYVLDGYEFAWNEFINSMQVVNLETLSTETGEKDYIACGTTVFRGEDLAVRGATYIFEIVEVVPGEDPSPVAHPNGVHDDVQNRPHEPRRVIDPGRQFRLRLLCKDESKGPVSAVCSMNGYLVSSMGQKIFVRAFELDERLVGVAFLDVGVYVTSLTSIKNLLLVGDARRSIMFAAFQEDPFKLLIVSRDTRLLSTVSADFVYNGGEMGIVTLDEEGIARVWRYDPLELETLGGQYLLLEAEFNTCTEGSACAIPLIQRSSWGGVSPGSMEGDEMSDGDPVLKVLWGHSNGSITALVPLTRPTFHHQEGFYDSNPYQSHSDYANRDITSSYPVPEQEQTSEMEVDSTLGTDSNHYHHGMAGGGDIGVGVDGRYNVSTGSKMNGYGGASSGDVADRYKRLHLLQGRMERGVMHVAGLNPRGFRAVPNMLSQMHATSLSSTSTRNNKGVLDGGLLQGFLELGLERQSEMCKEIGASRVDVIGDLKALSGNKAW